VNLLDALAALADPIRGRLLLALERHELAVGELAAALQLPSPR
jgi:DNA-binding transcriptional ArsR family regulator